MGIWFRAVYKMLRALVFAWAVLGNPHCPVPCVYEPPPLASEEELWNPDPPVCEERILDVEFGKNSDFKLADPAKDLASFKQRHIYRHVPSETAHKYLDCKIDDVHLGMRWQYIADANSDEDKFIEMERRRSLPEPWHLWPNGEVIYDPVFLGDASEEKKKARWRLVEAAMQNISDYTCITFRERAIEDGQNYITFKCDNCGWGSCSCAAGSIGTPLTTSSSMTLSGCGDVGVVVHEFFHLLGFYHEQQRLDRDNHLIVLEHRVRADKMKSNFIIPETRDDHRTPAETLALRQAEMDSPYDWASMMHYEADGFSDATIVDQNGNSQEAPTMVLKSYDPMSEQADYGSFDILAGQRYSMSQQDADQLNELYRDECAAVGSDVPSNPPVFTKWLLPWKLDCKEKGPSLGMTSDTACAQAIYDDPDCPEMIFRFPGCHCCTDLSRGAVESSFARIQFVLGPSKGKTLVKAQPVDCQWSAWSTWSQCSKSCGGGEKSRTRSIAMEARRNGQECSGSDASSTECNTSPCPVDCQWSAWSTWSQCSRTCGGGGKSQTRSFAVEALHGGEECSGSDTLSTECNTSTCLPALTSYGASPPSSRKPLGNCEGDCDKDSDCKGTLKCFQRSGTTTVPGCDGEGVKDYDYCYA